ncbi:MAG: NUDIX hydrolase [Candidatus Kariarchaeaceae archaeon]
MRKRTNLLITSILWLLKAWELFTTNLEAKNQRFSILRDHIEQTLKTRDERMVNRSELSGTLTEAAVLMPLVVSRNVWEEKKFDGLITDHIYLLLEKRSSHMNKNPGDMAFAGGKADEDDENLKFTAYREAEEELGIKSADLKFIAYMDEFVSTSKFIVRTVVSWLISDLDSEDFRNTVERNYKPLTDETEHTVVIPLTHLLNPSNYSNVKYDIKSELTNSRFGYIRYFDIHEFLYKTKIWGLTASMIRRLVDLIFPDNQLPKEPIL